VQEGPENSGFLGTFGIVVKIGSNAWEAAVLPLNYARGSPRPFEHDLSGKPVSTFPDHAPL
jgi:hypothetical protein